MTVAPPPSIAMTGEKILMTGVTGSVGRPLAMRLARANEVWGLARFGDETVRAELEEAGVTCVTFDLVDGDYSQLPDDFAYGLDFALIRTNDWETDVVGNTTGVARLMAHLAPNATAFLHCSSPVVYAYEGPLEQRTAPRLETDPLGDRHRNVLELETYAIGRILAEGTTRACAEVLGLRSVVARLNVPYGDCGGLPGIHLDQMVRGETVWLYPDTPNRFNPIHDDDVAAHIPALLAAADVPAFTVNWGGVDEVTVEEYCAFFGELLDIEPTFDTSDTRGVPTATMDLTRFHEIVPPTQVHWHDGMRSMVTDRYPDRVVGPDQVVGASTEGTAS